MKRLLCLALCVILVMSLLAGCGGNQNDTPTTTPKHTHSWSDTWSTNETSHWKTCAGCDMQAMLGAHIDDDKDGVCNDCGYAESCQHTFNEEKWLTDATSHWHPATCKHEGVKGAEAAHTDADNDGVCDVCQYADGQHTHTYSPDWSSNAQEHWHEATCGHSLVSDKAEHDDPENDGVCDVCGWFDQTHTHTFEEGWTTDAGYHWHGATCDHTGATQDISKHEDLDGDDFCDTCQYAICHHTDFDVDGICDICGYEDREHDHTFMDAWMSNHTGHWKTAQCHPGATTQVEDHLDRNNDGNCDICDYVICSHVYKKSWSSNDTHHWHQLLCTCSIETRKDYGEHVDVDGVNGCDVCMHGYQAPSPVELIIDKQPVTIDPSSMMTWTEVTIHIPKPGRYLITSDNTGVRWYLDKEQENAPTSYASEIYFEQAGDVTVLAQYFDFNYASKTPFEIKLTVTLIDDLVLNTSRGKAELPTNMTYKVVFEAMEVGTWTLQTSVAGVAMGVTVDSMEDTTSVQISVNEPGDLVELYVLYQDDTTGSTTFLFDWELTEPFQLDVGLGQSPVSVPAVGDTYKVVFTAPEDGRFLLNVTSEYLSFSEWGLGGFNRPVRTESTQQLTPEMKAGETFTTWLQTVYNYPQSTNVNDTLTIINVGTLLDTGVLGSREQELSAHELELPITYTATENGILTVLLENAVFGFMGEDGQVQYGTESLLSKQMTAGEELTYYVKHNGAVEAAKQTVSFCGIYQTSAEGDRFSFTAQENGYYRISVENGEIGITVNGVTQWVAAKDQDGRMVATYEVNMVAGDTYVFRIRSQSGEVKTVVETVRYAINMGDMYDKTADSMLEMGKELTVNMVPSKLYSLDIPDEMLQMKVKLSWDYKGVTVYVDGQVYKMGTELFLQDVKSITAKLQNNVAVDVKFSLLVTYASVQEEAVTEGVLPLNKDKTFLVEAESQAKASYTAEAGGTYILTCYTKGARIYRVNELGEMGELVLAVSNEDYVSYQFQLEADEKVEFIILTADGKQMTVKLLLTAPRA